VTSVTVCGTSNTTPKRHSGGTVAPSLSGSTANAALTVSAPDGATRTDAV
jgi:hypothetical protein